MCKCKKYFVKIVAKYAFEGVSCDYAIIELSGSLRILLEWIYYYLSVTVTIARSVGGPI